MKKPKKVWQMFHIIVLLRYPKYHLEGIAYLHYLLEYVSDQIYLSLFQLIVHNVLLHFENTRPIVNPLLKLNHHAKSLGIPTIYVNDNFGLWREDIGSVIKECKKGLGKDIVGQFIPEKSDFFIIKPKHSGFYGTQLNILLNFLEVENLILTGVAGDMCVLFTAFDAYMREYNLWVPSDCLASETVADNKGALRLMNRSMFANITYSTDVEIKEAFI